MKIDTSTTAGKIAVMQAYEDGKDVQFNNMNNAVGWETLESNRFPAWEWVICSYRIKPKTLDEAAKIYASTPKASLVNAAEYDFKSGAKWREENPKEQDQ